VGSLMASLYHPGNIRLVGLEKLWSIDGRVGDGPLRDIGRCLDVWEQEAYGVGWGGGQYGEKRNELGRIVVRQIGEDKGFGIVLVDSASPSATFTQQSHAGFIHAARHTEISSQATLGPFRLV